MGEEISVRSENWEDILFPTNEHGDIGVIQGSKIGQRLGLPFVRSLQSAVMVKICQNDPSLCEEIELLQDGTGVMGISGVIWDCALLLIDFLNYLSLISPHRRLPWRHVLDIGTGTGICGIGCGLLGAEYVLFTDSFLTTSLESNLEAISSSHRFRYDCVAYNWGDEVIPLPFVENMQASEKDSRTMIWDSILCSDLLYEAKNHSSLLSFLSRLQYRQLIIAYKQRHEEAEKLFFTSLSYTHEIKVVDISMIPLQNLPSQDPSSGLFLILARRKS